MIETPLLENPGTRTPATGVESRAMELFAEVKSLFAQWSEEVPNGRKAWPESIKKRVLELWAIGVSTHQIAQEAEVPVQTLYSWRQKMRKSGFLELKVQDRKPPRRTWFQIEQDKERRSPTLQPLRLDTSPTTFPSCLTVVIGDQLRFEGVTEDFALRLARELWQR